MEFWGVEVKAGEPLKVKPGFDKIIHLSQASLGESKKDKGNESIPLFMKIDDQRLVLGTLSLETFPQLSFDLVFEKEFELSHNWKNGSVYFFGYKAVNPDQLEEDLYDSDEDSEFDEPLTTENGKLEPKAEPAKPATAKADAAKPDAAKPESSAKPKVKLVEPKKDDKPSEDDGQDDDSSDDVDEDSEDDDDEDDDEEMIEGDDGSDEEDEDEDEDEDEETPKKAELSKKRTNESATKTPVPAKKAKVTSPQKTDGKKGGHTATPHPSKQAGKTPANSDKSKAQTPKSGGQVSCKSCPKTFKSEDALQSHTKAKHGGK